MLAVGGAWDDNAAGDHDRGFVGVLRDECGIKEAALGGSEVLAGSARGGSAVRVVLGWHRREDLCRVWGAGIGAGADGHVDRWALDGSNGVFDNVHYAVGFIVVEYTGSDTGSVYAGSILLFDIFLEIGKGAAERAREAGMVPVAQGERESGEMRLRTGQEVGECTCNGNSGNTGQ